MKPIRNGIGRTSDMSWTVREHSRGIRVIAFQRKLEMRGMGKIRAAGMGNCVGGNFKMTLKNVQSCFSSSRSLI